MLSFDAFGECAKPSAVRCPVTAFESVQDSALKVNATCNSLLSSKVVSNPKVFIVINTTSRFLRTTNCDRRAAADLKRAAQVLQEEKKAVLEFLDEQGYRVEPDCIIEDQTKRGIFYGLKERISRIPEVAGESEHDGLMMWFFGIDSDSCEEIILTEDGGLSIDEVHWLFKTKPGVHKFRGKPKMFFFFKLKGIAPSVVRKRSFSDDSFGRIPLDADFWTCLVDVPISNKPVPTIISMMTDCVRNTTLDVELDDLMYSLKARWSKIPTDLPVTSSTLRFDVFLRKMCNPFLF